MNKGTVYAIYSKSENNVLGVATTEKIAETMIEKFNATLAEDGFSPTEDFVIRDSELDNLEFEL